MKVAINYSDIHRQTGAKTAHVCHRHGVWTVDSPDLDTDIVIFEPPYQIGDQTSCGIVKSVVIKKGHWLIEFEVKNERDKIQRQTKR